MISNKDKYKTIRIHPEDFRYLKSMAYHKRSTIVDCVSYIINEDKRRILGEKMHTIESLTFMTEHQKDIFLRYVMNFPETTKNNDKLVIYYINAALGIYCEETPYKSTQKWKDMIRNSAGTTYLTDEDAKVKQLVEVANVLLQTVYYEELVKLLLKIESELLTITTTMIQLKLYGLD